MRQIIYLLSGNNAPPPLLDRQLDRFVQKMRDETEDVIWNANFFGSDLAKQAYEEFGQLTHEQRIRFFVSPDGFQAVFTALRTTSDANIAKLLSALQNARNASEAGPIWPADTVVPEDQSPDRMLLADTITIDIGSELCRRVDVTSPVFMSPHEELTNAEANTVREKLHNAFTEIEEFSPSLARMIRNYTRTIYVRKAGNLVPSSEQVDSELGAIRLRSLHSDLYAPDQVVDDIIHESTHNLLGTFEYLNYPFIPIGLRPSPDLRPVSPWSMRAIQVLPFLHAAFVYFGMLHYVEGRLAQGVADVDRRRSCQKRRNRYASGFLMPGRLSDFATSLSNVDPRVVMALDWMQETVRARYSASNTRQSSDDVISSIAA